MNALILPGNSSSNRSWARELRHHVKHYFKTIKVHEYLHWQTGNDVIDLGKEQVRLRKSIQDLEIDYVLAKSAGIALCLKSIKDRVINPKKAVFMGLPVGWMDNQEWDYKSWFKGQHLECIFIHNEHDPVSSAHDAESFLASSGIEKYKLIILKGDDHTYDDWKTISASLDNLIND